MEFNNYDRGDTDGFGFDALCPGCKEPQDACCCPEPGDDEIDDETLAEIHQNMEEGDLVLLIERGDELVSEEEIDAACAAAYDQLFSHLEEIMDARKPAPRPAPASPRLHSHDAYDTAICEDYYDVGVEATPENTWQLDGALIRLELDASMPAAAWN